MLKVDRQKVVLARAGAALTTRELANMSSVAVSTISKIENGHIDPNPVTLGRIAKALKISVEELLISEN